jgi:hypothetical protein
MTEDFRLDYIGVMKEKVKNNFYYYAVDKESNTNGIEP